MAEAGVRRTPNEDLAASVVALLGAAGLVPKARLAELEKKLVLGTVKEEDWRLLVERGLEEDAQRIGDGAADR